MSQTSSTSATSMAIAAKTEATWISWRLMVRMVLPGDNC